MNRYQKFVPRITQEVLRYNFVCLHEGRNDHVSEDILSLGDVVRGRERGEGCRSRVSPEKISMFRMESTACCNRNCCAQYLI